MAVNVMQSCFAAPTAQFFAFGWVAPGYPKRGGLFRHSFSMQDLRLHGPYPDKLLSLKLPRMSNPLRAACAMLIGGCNWHGTA